LCNKTHDNDDDDDVDDDDDDDRLSSIRPTACDIIESIDPVIKNAVFLP